jgi:hypothetical protein
MNGQWIGRYTSNGSGKVSADIDAARDGYYAVVHLVSDDPKLPLFVISFRTRSKSKSFKLKKMIVGFVHRPTGKVLSAQDLQELYPRLTFPKSVDADWVYRSGKIKIKWKTDIKTVVTLN